MTSPEVKARVAGLDRGGRMRLLAMMSRCAAYWWAECVLNRPTQQQFGASLLVTQEMALICEDVYARVRAAT